MRCRRIRRRPHAESEIVTTRKDEISHGGYGTRLPWPDSRSGQECGAVALGGFLHQVLRMRIQARDDLIRSRSQAIDDSGEEIVGYGQ